MVTTRATATVGNPTCDGLEARVAALKGGVVALA